jgi:hypothetical protein
MRNFDLISVASLIDSAKACADVLLLSMGSSILLYIGCPYEEKRHGSSSDWIVRQFRLNLSIAGWAVNEHSSSSAAKQPKGFAAHPHRLLTPGI